MPKKSNQGDKTTVLMAPPQDGVVDNFCILNHMFENSNVMVVVPTTNICIIPKERSHRAMRSDMMHLVFCYVTKLGPNHHHHIRTVTVNELQGNISDVTSGL